MLPISLEDIIIGALCAWRENRGGGIPGMTSVINVLTNRAEKNASTIYHEATKPYQFFSMTEKSNPELVLYPEDNDPQFMQAIELMMRLKGGKLSDLTDGATMYFAENITKAPTWDVAYTKTTTVAGQVFFK